MTRLNQTTDVNLGTITMFIPPTMHTMTTFYNVAASHSAGWPKLLSQVDYHPLLKPLISRGVLIIGTPAIVGNFRSSPII